MENAAGKDEKELQPPADINSRSLFVLFIKMRDVRTHISYCNFIGGWYIL